MTNMKESFDRLVKAFNAHDAEAFADELGERVDFRAPGGVNGEGKAACVGFFAAWWTAFSDAAIVVDALHASDDILIEEGTFTGTQDGVLQSPGSEIPATGRAVRMPYVQVHRFQGGKDVSLTMIFDRLELLEQLGMR